MPGKSGNPSGRAKGSITQKEILQALDWAGKKFAKCSGEKADGTPGRVIWLRQLAFMSFKEPVIATALLKKLVPDQVKNEVSGRNGEDIKVVVDFTNMYQKTDG